MTDQSPEQWRTRLRDAHRLLHEAMTALIENQDYSAAESLLRAADKAMLDLIKEAKGYVPREPPD